MSNFEEALQHQRRFAVRLDEVVKAHEDAIQDLNSRLTEHEDRNIDTFQHHNDRIKGLSKRTREDLDLILESLDKIERSRDVQASTLGEFRRRIDLLEADKS